VTSPTPDVYALRAANAPRPADWVEPEADHHLTLEALMAPQYELFADISEFQTVYTDAYPYQIASFRVDNGGRLDYHAADNWAWCKSRLATGRLKMAIAYVVFQPGRNAEIVSRVRGFFGPAPKGLAIHIDMESGSEFAGPGNHSAEANQLAALLAAYTGTPGLQREYAYANTYDYASNWPQISPALKKHTASYGSEDPGTYGQQYYGGMPQYPVPAGLPKTCAPFGGYVDLNIIRKPMATILTDFFPSAPAPIDPDWITMATVQQIMALPTPPRFVKFLRAAKPNAIYKVLGQQLGWVDPHNWNVARTQNGNVQPHLEVLDTTAPEYHLPIVPGTPDPRK
jgi:hypothetical protein